MEMENKISKDNNFLVALSHNQEKNNDLQYLMENFCGEVVKKISEIQTDQSRKRVYVCGDINELDDDDKELFIIKELSYNYEKRKGKNIHIIGLGQVPIVICNAGVYFRQLFIEADYFQKIKSEHEFQDLTESTKPGTSFRKGIYLTNVSKEETEEHNEILHFRLLRCSSNLSGPTDNFRYTDQKIIKEISDAARYVFELETNLNHVLAQIYENKMKEGLIAKEAKAKIKAHSDKTKDMPKDALIAFFTFYDSSGFKQLKPSNTDKYDWCYKDKSGLTKLHFKLKNTVNDDSLEKEFSITLYPNSVFLIPLSTNRLYTHEIKPSMLNIDKIPTRMGYVARCSKAEALFMNNQTYLKENEYLIKLEPMNNETATDLRNSYFEENTTEHIVEYRKIHFSMNAGDYQKPIY